MICRKSVFKATHNMIHLNLSLALLLGLVVFVSGIETANDSKARKDAIHSIVISIMKYSTTLLA